MTQQLKQSEFQTFKWTGSKWLIAKDIMPLIPSSGETYYEPFLGGGAILMNSIPRFKKTIGGDLYSPLIELWKMLRDAPNEIEKIYTELWNSLESEVKEIDIERDRGKNFPKIFYKCREEFNKTKDPALLLFLTKTCLNGVIRFSQVGNFNNSFHHGRLGQIPRSFSKCVKSTSNHITNTKFLSVDALELLKDVKKDDFVFLDPPYFESKNRYIENYLIEDLEELIDFLNSRSAKWICTYDSRNNIKLRNTLFKRKLNSSKYQSRIRRVSGQGIVDTLESIYLNY